MSDLQDLSVDLKAVQAEMDNFAQTFLRKASAEIAQKATQNHMRRAGSATSRRSAGDKGPLRIVSGRLAKSLTGSRFAGAGDESIDKIDTLRDGLVRLIKGSEVPYAGIHEHGGTMDHTVPVTDKMRRFFWAKHYETGRDKWKAMALTKKDRFKITGKIPARPYLGPAFEAALPELRAMAEEDLKRFVSDAIGA